MKNILQLCFVLALGPLLVSCGGSSTLDNTEASVFLTVEIEGYNPDIDICVQLGDVFIEDMKIESSLKDPSGTISANQDVNLNRWVISPYRTDGGSTASPEWIYDQAVFVAAGGTASLSNYRVSAKFRCPIFCRKTAVSTPRPAKPTYARVCSCRSSAGRSRARASPPSRSRSRSISSVMASSCGGLKS